VERHQKRDEALKVLKKPGVVSKKARKEFKKRY